MSSNDIISEPRNRFAIIVVVVFAVSLFSSFIFTYFIHWPPWLEIILGAVLSIVILYPIFSYIIYGPFARDLKDHREIDKQLRLLSAALEAAENTIFITDKDGIIQWVNPAFERLTGYTSREAVGKTARILKSGKQQLIYYERLWSAILAGNPWHSEMVNKKKDGSFFSVDQIITPIKDSEGRITNFVAIQQDITDRKQYERTIEESRLKSEAIIASIGDGLALMDAQGRILLVNTMFEEMTGYAAGDLVGKKIVEMIGAEDLSGVRIPESERPGSRVLAPPYKEIEEKYRLIRKDGSKMEVSVIISPVRVQDEIVGIVQVYRDITKDVAIDKMKSEFVSLASHQLRTPLSTVNWYSEMLLDGDAGVLTDKQKEYQTEIYNANKRMVGLVNSLLNVSRIESGTFGIEPQEVKTREAVESLLKDMKAELTAKNIVITPSYDNVDTINVDPKLLRMILQNLLTNAVHYTPARGSVSLSVTKTDKDILFTITDSGIGIPASVHDKIFTKMYRADNARKVQPDGNGLGLYMVKSILEQAGGKIWFDSAEGKGSTFYVAIPLSGMKKKEGSKQLTE